MDDASCQRQGGGKRSRHAVRYGVQLGGDMQIPNNTSRQTRREPRMVKCPLTRGMVYFFGYSKL